MDDLASRVARVEVLEAAPASADSPFSVAGLRYDRLVVRAHPLAEGA